MEHLQIGLQLEENIEHIKNVSKGTSTNYKQDYYEYTQYRPCKLLQIESGTTFGDEMKIKGIVRKISTSSTYILPRNDCSYTIGRLILSSFGGGLSHFTEEPLTLGDDWLQIYYLVYNIYFEILTKTELKMFRSIGMAPNYDLKDETRVKKTEIEPFIQENTLYELLTYYFEAYHDYTDEAIRKYINELIPLYTPTSIATGNKIRTRPRPATKRSIKNSTRRATRAPIRRATRRAPNRLRRPPTRRAPNRLTRLQHLRDIKKDTYNPTYISNKRYRPLNKSIFLNI